MIIGKQSTKRVTRKPEISGTFRLDLQRIVRKIAPKLEGLDRGKLVDHVVTGHMASAIFVENGVPIYDILLLAAAGDEGSILKIAEIVLDVMRAIKRSKGDDGIGELYAMSRIFGITELFAPGNIDWNTLDLEFPELEPSILPIEPMTFEMHELSRIKTHFELN